ncbi:M14 family zinc carboxypeptidase [Pseudobacteriovorax antillogorgiicola]|uniref:Zinc carboxypeptidase n=1 Tax=Pseudobacteriovorax antillogorgiicola TaxID=1513793 RepID=A0A1Y6CTK8_9BACT|nr:M14 family zinc carboxypeptidase [Pseudobacteriovorax antillogorgiicola]TCS44618.1 zinc carboxypeptidase [Pseudobacteriovorax antillogorgiicola]SMF78332.1 Zinc carboxypeptidase [Pseudobacteriovorax antillogorgiicola]
MWSKHLFAFCLAALPLQAVADAIPPWGVPFYPQEPQKAEIGEIPKICRESLAKLPGEFDKARIAKACDEVQVLPTCKSVAGDPIYHYDSKVQPSTRQKKVLVLGLMHGDEAEGGSVARRWMERLVDLTARNQWRIVPILNPDGWEAKTRMNANGVDINRNFPSKDWDELAHKYWVQKKGKDPRRNPGPSAGSEPETKCTIKHIEDFRPDFIVAIHTPYGVLDFDGPKIRFPNYKWIPWVSLGTFPGSLGRYMWKDKNVPVLTVELKDSKLLEKMDQLDFLQDIAGTVAMRASKKRPRMDAVNDSQEESNN